MILPKRVSGRYMKDGTLQAVYQALKSGTFEHQFSRMTAIGQELRQIYVTNTSGADLSGTNGLLRKLVEQGSEQVTVQGGMLIRKRGNWTEVVKVG